MGDLLLGVLLVSSLVDLRCASHKWSSAVDECLRFFVLLLGQHETSVLGGPGLVISRLRSTIIVLTTIVGLRRALSYDLPRTSKH